jgi:hypothetical protein
MKSLKHFIAILLIFLVASSLAAWLSTSDHQPDIISKQTGFVSPLIGPWSMLLPPHEMKASSTSSCWMIVCTVLSIVSLPSILIMPYLTKKRWARIVVNLLGYTIIVLWCLSGIFRVFMEIVRT